MPFLKIEDPEKRDQIVKEFLDNKKRIHQNNLYEKMGEANLQLDLTKLYKPLIDNKAGIKVNISKLHDQANKFALTFSNAYPEIMAEHTYKELIPSYKKTKNLRLGKIATDYLRMYTNSKKSTDTTFGIHSKDDKLYIGKSPVFINDDDITIDSKTYYGTPGLWELITKDAITTENPNKPRSSRSGKYREKIAPIWRDIKKNENCESKGTGLPTIILPSDLNALIEMFELRIAAWKAGNTGSRNEAFAIYDELLQQVVINSAQYKAIQNNL
ncbi:uncharacterized protein LOC136091815 [Hydra vulgaris]|uniref:Uncharacterized protein LOC136091815 n=1 Tax=Hydra vulgaris TaxID=6087 RepID=A0ABM4DM17_HYDVU